MTEKPLWLLDVDGTINASRAGWGSAPHSGNAYAKGERYRIRWAPQLVKRIRDLHNSGLVDIVWASTWNPWANEIEALLGLPHFDRAFTEECWGQASKEAKFQAALTAVENGIDLIWTDDEAISKWYEEDLREVAEGKCRLLLIRPNAHKGLRPEDLDAIEEFLGYNR